MCDADEKALFIKGVVQKETREMMCRTFVQNKKKCHHRTGIIINMLCKAFIVDFSKHHNNIQLMYSKIMIILAAIFDYKSHTCNVVSVVHSRNVSFYVSEA